MHLKASFAAGAVKYNPAAVRLGNLPGHGQPQPYPFRLVGGERLEQAIDHFPWRPGTVIENAEDDLRRLMFGSGQIFIPLTSPRRVAFGDLPSPARGKGSAIGSSVSIFVWKRAGLLGKKFCFNSDPAAGASGVGGVQHQVHQQLPKLGGIGIEKLVCARLFHNRQLHAPMPQ
jgi:hypothetical protein